MDRSTQTKFIAAVSAIAKDAGMELVHDPQWGNTGRLRIEPADGFVPVLEMTYNFQQGYAGFEGIPGGKDCRCPGRKTTHDHYVTIPGELPAVIERIRATVVAAKKPARRTTRKA